MATETGSESDSCEVAKELQALGLVCPDDLDDATNHLSHALTMYLNHIQDQAPNQGLQAKGQDMAHACTRDLPLLAQSEANKSYCFEEPSA